MASPTLRWMSPGSFEPEQHFYPRVPNAVLHPLVRSFFSLGNDRIAKRYCHLHPEADAAAVHRTLAHATQFMRWSGADLFHVTNDKGVRSNVVIETNSCPSGQKSMPVRGEDERGGYLTLLEGAFMPGLRAQRGLPNGCLAVLCDKNPMETTGYASALADLSGEKVLWAHLPAEHWDAHARWDQGVLHLLHEGEWVPVRAALRYITQKPWTRIPPLTRTWLFNPVLVCLSGGRNKLLAAKAYDLFNASTHHDGLRIRVPETIWDVALPEVPLWVERMGGIAVVKNPYSNAGQGVYTITSKAELDAFMALEHSYDRFIVQAMVGNLGWTSRSRQGRLYHVGTVPNKKGEIYVADLRMMVGCGPEGFFPVAIYARRAREPLLDELTPEVDSWSMLGTNLSVKTGDGFSTESQRLMMADQRDFNRLGLGLDDLTEAYLQTCMSTIAIDDMAQRLVTTKRKLRRRLFASLNPDVTLTNEVLQ